MGLLRALLDFFKQLGLALLAYQAYEGHEASKREAAHAKAAAADRRVDSLPDGAAADELRRKYPRK